MNFKDICRLCGKENGIHINIFESTPECLAKIESVVPDVVILRNDSLPKLICHRCVAKVKDFHEFKETCIQTQRLLKEKLPWMSSHVNHQKNVHSQRPVSPVVKFIGGPLAYPYGDPEPVVEVLTLSDDEEVGGGSVPSDSSNTSVPASSRQQKRTVSNVSPLRGPAGKKSCFNGNGSYGSGIHSAMPPQRDFHLPMRSLQSATSSTSSVRPQPVSTTFAEFQRRLSAPFTNQPTNQMCASVDTSKTVTPGSKWTSLQPTVLSCTMDKNLNQSRTVSLPNMREKQPANVSTEIIQSVSEVTSTLPEISTNIETNFNNNKLLPPVPPAVPIRNVESVRKSEILPCNDIPKASEEPIHVNSTQVADNPDSVLKSVDKGKKNRVSKPGPKCKKKPIELTEADRQRICERYPKMEAVKICENTIIFTCLACNKILMTEEAISQHECCVMSSETKTGDSCKLEGENKSKSFIQNEDSNHSTSSSVELICFDDEISEKKSEPMHSCRVCGKQFLYPGRLQRHELSHTLSEAS